MLPQSKLTLFSSSLLYLERFLFVAFLALLVWAPLPLGSNRNWAMALLAMGLGAVLLLSWFVLTLRGQSPLRRCLSAWLPLSALVAFAALVAIQAWVGLFATSSGFGIGSVDPFQTRHYLLCTLVYLAAFVLVLLLVGSEKRAKYFIFTLIGAALFQGMLAIVLFSTRATYTVFFESISHGSQTIGTYVNRNHLACYLYLGLSLGVGWILGAMTGEQAKSRAKAQFVALLKFLLSGRMALRLLLIVLVIALVLTRSRMGNGAFLAGLLSVAAMVWWRLPATRRTVGIVVFSLLLVDVVIIGQWVGLERVVQRMESTALVEEGRRGEETVEARLQPALHTLPMIAQKPLFGYGGGTYYTAFPPFKSGDMLLHLLYFDHAHNDYAEIAADVGLVGLMLLAVVALSTSVRVWKLASLRYTSSTRAVAYGVWMALCCVGVHSWVDFNLQIPANALTFTVILALAWAAPWRCQPNGLALR